MSIYNRIRQLQDQRTVTMRLPIKNMTTQKDYQIIAEALKKQKGVEDVMPFSNHNILHIVYNPLVFNIHAVNYLLGQLGYELNIKKSHMYQSRPLRKGG